MVPLALMASLLVAALPAQAQPKLGAGTGDQEHREDGDHAAPAAAPAPAPAPAPAEAVARPAEKSKPAPRDYVPATHSVSVDLGGGVNLLGGWAYPKIVLKGTPDEEFYSHGLGAGMKLHWDFPAQDLDWRVGLEGTLPGFAALNVTVGVRKDLGPWTNPRLLVRAGGGIEFLCGAGQRRTAFFVPVFLGKGEVALEVTVIENLLSLGLGAELALKYGIPAGLGFDAHGFVRTEVWF